MILKFNNLEQARSNTIYNIFENRLYYQVGNVRENISIKLFRNQNLKRSTIQKLKLRFWKSLSTNEMNASEMNREGK